MQSTILILVVSLFYVALPLVVEMWASRRHVSIGLPQVVLPMLLAALTCYGYYYDKLLLVFLGFVFLVGMSVYNGWVCYRPRQHQSDGKDNNEGSN